MDVVVSTFLEENFFDFFCWYFLNYRHYHNDYQGSMTAKLQFFGAKKSVKLNQAPEKIQVGKSQENLLKTFQTRL